MVAWIEKYHQSQTGVSDKWVKYHFGVYYPFKPPAGSDDGVKSVAPSHYDDAWRHAGSCVAKKGKEGKSAPTNG